MHLTLRSRIRDYDVCFEQSPAFVSQFLDEKKYFVVIDDNVLRLHRDGPLGELADKPHVHRFTALESEKELGGVAALYDRLLAYGAKRNTTLVSMGGGIVQDVTGFVASTLYRGIDWVFVPTTLLAQADSCIGSKTSLNYKGYKNLLGSFFPPTRVHLYPGFIATLARDDYLSGLGEVAKLHLLAGDAHLRHLLASYPALLARDAVALEGAIAGSLRIKAEYITDDEFDTGRRNLLNFGHCFGHALESTSGYRVPHGQAVTVGMLFANVISVRRGWLASARSKQIASQLLLPLVGVSLSRGMFEPAALVEAMKRDKKRTADGLAIILIKDDATFEKVQDLTPDEVVATTQELLQQLPL